jgi:adenylate cyclase
MDSYLIITSEHHRRVSLAGKQDWMIGRGRGNDISFDDTAMSRRHALLQVTEAGEAYVVDFGSRNGSFLNGNRIEGRVKLNDGDRLSFGQVQAEFHCSGDVAIVTPEVRTVAGTIPLHRRQLLSVLVIDIRQFTSLAQALGEEKLADVIGRFFHRAGEIIRAHASRIDKYIGDAVMAVWFHDEHADADPTIMRVLRALRDICNATHGLNSQLALPFAMRIGAGVNTGYAIVGNTGHADFTALGDTVNAAFRMESATKDLRCDIVIGEETHARLLVLTNGPAPFVRREVELKGFGMRAVYACTFKELDDFLGPSSVPSQSA